MGSKPLVGIGLISYSAYLWHFPIMAFSRLGSPLLNIYDKLIWVFLIFGLSVISYYFIEQPFRNQKVISLRLMMASFIFFLVSTVSIHMLMIKSDGYPTRVAKIFRDIESLHGEKWGLIQDEKPCFGRQKDLCEYKNNKSSWVQLIGDSHLESLNRNLFERLSEKFSISDMTSGGCWPIGLIIKTTGNGPLDKSPCKEEYQRLRLKKAMSKNNSIIVF